MIVEVVDLEEEDREDISLNLIHFCLRYTRYTHSSGGLLAKPRSWITPFQRKGGNMNIFVGNLSLEVTDGELRREFMAFGEVVSVTIMNDQYIGSGQQRGYGFVEMPSQAEGKAAVTALNEKALRQMTISVIEALPLSHNRDKNSYGDKRSGWSNSRVRQRRY
jgi:RNA recognition motif-containing protein